MSLILPTVLLALLSGLLYHLYLYGQNLTIARRIGLPYFSSIIPDNKTWYFIAMNMGPLFHLLPHRLAAYVNFTTYLRRWHSKYTVHEEVGDVLVMITSGAMHVYVADADAAQEVLNGRGRFWKPSWNYSHLKLFGDNVVACDDTTWVHHRKHVGPPFNERNNGLVWTQAIAQATGMLQSWHTQPPLADYAAPSSPNSLLVSSTLRDFRRITLYVISSAAFGVSLSFSTGVDAANTGGENAFFSDGTPPPGYSRCWRAALEHISLHLPTIIAALSLPAWASRGARKAIADVEGYVNALIRREREKVKEKGASTAGVGGGNLLSSLVHTHTEDDGGTDTLTDREIIGNTFIFSIAGHETTATTMQYALVMLALHPEEQEWFLNRLDEQLAGLPEDPSQWDYKVYDRLAVVRCLMLETLRLFPPVPGHAKSTLTPQPLTFRGQTHHLPAHTMVTVNAAGLHQHPSYWGPHASRFQPALWDATNKTSHLAQFPQPEGDWAEAPGLYRPRMGSYVPFSGGQRVCLGRKFASVEFVAVVAVVMRGRRVRCARKGAETQQQAMERVRGCVDRSTGLMALCMTDEVGVVLEER